MYSRKFNNQKLKKSYCEKCGRFVFYHINFDKQTKRCLICGAMLKMDDGLQWKMRGTVKCQV